MSLDALIDRYAAGAAILSYAVSGLTSEQGRARPGPGAWSIAERVAHVADSDLVLADRMKRVIAEDDPPLLAFDQDAWIDRLASQEMLVEEAVNLFAANRQWMTRVLRRLPAGAFARAGTHGTDGRLSLAELVVKAANHLDYHLTFLYAKRASLGVSVYPRYTREPVT